MFDPQQAQKIVDRANARLNPIPKPDVKQVVIVGIDIPFRKLFSFMTKLILATIPAIIAAILVIIALPLWLGILSGPHH